MTEAEAIAQLTELFGEDPWPEAVRFVRALGLVRSGYPPAQAAKSVRSTRRQIQRIIDSPDPLAAALGGYTPAPAADLEKAKRAIGQMVLGRAAERVFLDLFRDTFNDEDLDIENVSAAATDTDIYLVNGKRRRLYRINIKFFGSIFRRAEEIVGLPPDDCFALATYKIRSALEKQNDEGKPYFFAIVGVAGLTADVAGEHLPEETLRVASIVLSSNAPRKRQFEDRVVDYAVSRGLEAYSRAYDRIREAPWFVLSAERAARLMRDMLFDRVPALTVRNFTRVFRGAEVDMHFSLSTDLTPLPEFFEHLKTEGRERVATLLSRGDL